ncbi:hypothetical protein ElyMa_004186700 [Elysia marginata]|uniref:LolA-like domain-containing protein n=1 Tax=Elysia marginata TaxID=1093978 RepID=A0AAV4GKZ7_9GAST|nr:hypothetical protein ElyMa_004186700 [Elysia marginata]
MRLSKRHECSKKANHANMAAFCDRFGVRLILLALLPLWATCLDSYDKARCDDLTNGAKSLQNTPLFLSDFTFLSETAILKNETGSGTAKTPKIFHEKFSFSDMYRQVMRYQETPWTWNWLYVDQPTNDCLYKDPGRQCEDLPNTCSSRASEFVDKNNEVNVGSYLSALQYPKPNKEEVSLGPSSVRGISSLRYATCAYDQTSQVTTVSEWHILDPQQFTKMDKLSANLLMAHHKKYKDGSEISDERTDYTEYSKLLYSDLPNGLQIGEVRCGHILGDFRSVEPPTPSVRHGYTSEFDAAKPNQVISDVQYNAYTEYNYNSQILFQVTDAPVVGENEKETTVEVYDFLTKHAFRYSLTNGNCRVEPNFDLNGYSGMPLPQSYWLFPEMQEPSYLGIYYNRDIPCHTWLFEYPAGAPGIPSGSTVTLYLATSDWLEKQGMDTDMFYPVQKIIRSPEGNDFESIFEYRDNPGYHIPELLSCFDRDDIVAGKLTLKNTNYYKLIAHNEVSFEYRFRSFIQEITGIKSHLRVAKITAAPSQKRVDETDVAFLILGQFAGINSTNSIAYRTDPVTSKEAADKINKAVDKGDAKFSLDFQSITLHLKKGSFSVLKNDDHFENVDNPRQNSPSSGSSGYSGTIMAVSGLCIVIGCFVVSLLAVILYKRWTEGQDILPSFGMQTLSNEK